LIEDLWRSKTGVLSTQVLQEFYVTVSRKVLHPKDNKTAWRWVSHYANWRIIANDHIAVLDAIDIERRFKTSFWNAMIVQAAITANVKLLYSQDMNHDRHYDGICVKDPFKE